jgi:hypothetical protein
MLVGFAMLVFSAFFVRRAYRYDPPPRDKDLPLLGATGFGGWLVLPTLSVVLMPVTFVWLMFVSWDVFDMTSWLKLGTSPHPTAARAYFVVLFALAIFLLAYALLIAVVYFRRRSSAPRHWVVMLCLALAFEIYAMVGGVRLQLLEFGPREISDLVRDAAMTAIWWAYMHKSKRVKGTFVRRLHTPSAVESGDAARFPSSGETPGSVALP